MYPDSAREIRVIDLVLARIVLAVAGLQSWHLIGLWLRNDYTLYGDCCVVEDSATGVDGCTLIVEDVSGLVLLFLG